MRKIALRGLIGKKRDTLLLWSVVALSFLFLVLSTTLITSIQETDTQQRISTYGKWQNLISGISSKDSETFASFAETSAVLPMVNVSGVDYFSGDNEYYVTTYSPKIEELGQLKLKEGKWPEEKKEIALEYARLSSLNLKLGDSFKVVSEISLPLNKDYSIKKEERRDELYKIAAAAFIEEKLEVFRNKTWNETDRTGFLSWTAMGYEEAFFHWYMDKGVQKEAARAFIDKENPEGRYIPIEEMTEEEFMVLLDFYVSAFVQDFDLAPFMTEKELNESANMADLIGYENLNIRVSIKNDNILIIIPYTYTVCGVVDTFSDRWDSGNIILPSGFVTEENYNIYVNSQKTVLEKYINYDYVEYENVIFLSDGENSSARELWKKVLPEFNSSVDKNSQLINSYYVFNKNEDGTSEYQYYFEFYLCDSENEELIFTKAVLIPDESRNIEDYNIKTDLSEISAYIIEVPENAMRENGLGRIIFPTKDGVFSVEVPPVDNASVKIEYAGTEYFIPYEDFINCNFEINGLYPTSQKHIFESAIEKQDDFSALRINSFTYPSSSEGNDRMLVLVTIILFVTTVCAVFQIFFTQMRKRMRRIILMKSIGAESGQIAEMLIWEFIYFWITTLPVGTVFGIGGAYITTTILEKIQNRDILFTVDYKTLIAAILAGTIALFIGMIIPSIMAIGVPLTGRTARKKPLAPPKKEVRQTFFNVTLRGLTANKGRTLGNFALCAFMMLITCLCIFIGFRFMTPYRETVKRDSRPDYFLSLPFSASDRQLTEYLEEIEALGVSESIEVFRNADDSAISESSVDSVLLDAAFGENIKIINDSYGKEDFLGYPAELYAVSSDSELFEKLSSAITVENINKEAFDSGKEVILFVPLYKDTGKENDSALQTATGWERVSALGIDTSYYKEYRNAYDKDTAVSVGSKITIGAHTRYISGITYTYRLITENVKVGAIIYYFPEEGIWPISGSEEGYQIICSSKLCGSVLPNSMRTRSTNEIRAFKVMYMSSGYGTTDFYINAKEGLSKYDVDTTLLVYARSEYMDIEFYHESNSKLLQDAINNILLVCILGLTAVLLALMIFANTITSDIEQERNRIGILQSLGVSNKQLTLRQLYIGLTVSGIAVAFANILLWSGIAIYALLSGNVLGNLLWGYPWLLHVAACILLAIIITVLYVVPMKNVERYLPIENIKTRK